MLYTIGIGDLEAAELDRLLAPVSVVFDIRHHDYPERPPARSLPTLQTPVDHVPELGGIVDCSGPLFDRGIDSWLHDHVRYGIPNPWTYLEPYAYMWYTLTTPFILALDSHRPDNACFLCDQEDWWLCHRGVLADYLGFHGHEVMHLGRRQWLHRHYMTGRLERYDPRVIQKWEERANR